MNEEKTTVAALPPAPDLNIVGPPPKRKKGRPPKNRALLPGGESSPAPAPPKPDGKGRKPKRKNGDVVWPAVDGTYVGQQVHGVLDGSFDAGYLLTVRVGNTQTVLRGAVFEPSLSVPITESNDVAPNVKFVGRGELPAPPLPSLLEHVYASASLSSPSIVPPMSLGKKTASVPMEEDRRSASKFLSAPLTESSHVPSGAEANDQKYMAPSQMPSSGVGADNQKDAAALQVPSGAATDDQKGTAPPQVPLSGIGGDSQMDMAQPQSPSGAAAEGQKGMAPPVQSRDNVTEEKMDMQVEPQL